MAQKTDAKPGASANASGEVGASRRDDRILQRGVPTKLKPSVLVDMCVVYCGDNLERFIIVGGELHSDPEKIVANFV